jgi:hypothetical protein
VHATAEQNKRVAYVRPPKPNEIRGDLEMRVIDICRNIKGSLLELQCKVKGTNGKEMFACTGDVPTTGKSFEVSPRLTTALS